VNGGDEILVREGVPADLHAIARLERASFSDPWPREALLTELHVDRLRRPLVAENDGAVIGFLMAWSVVDELHIINLAVDEIWRRRAVGTRLLEAALAAGRDEGCVLATLEVRSGNLSARAFYLRHAFLETGLRRRYYQDGEDAVIMTRQL
jgi:[ribosomal protein S18]-alanine N-acetyltransferase